MTNEILGNLGAQIDDVFFLIAVAVLLIELAEAWFKGNLKKRNIVEMIVSVSTQIPSIAFEMFIMTSAYAVYYILAESYVSWSIPLTWWSIAIGLLVADFFYYWEHRIAHEVRLLWTQHAVHHSSRDYNIITAVRFGPFEGVWALIAHIPMIAMGFSPEMVFFGQLTVLAYQTWLHTESIGKLGPFEKVFNTPSHHRVHHGSDRKYLDRNYAGILIIWDRMFGTYQVEEETPIYGLTRDFNSQNPLKVWFSELPQLGRDLKAAKSGHEVFMRLFAGPGWQPK